MFSSGVNYTSEFYVFPPLTWLMLSSCLRVWKSRRSSGGALSDTSNLNAEPHGHEVIYHIGVCWHQSSLASGCLGTTSLTVQHAGLEKYWSEQLPDFCWEGFPCACTSICDIQEILRLFLGFLGTEDHEEKFMCRNTLDSMWLRMVALCVWILDCPNHQRVAFGKLRHMRAYIESFL